MTLKSRADHVALPFCPTEPHLKGPSIILCNLNGIWIWWHWCFDQGVHHKMVTTAKEGPHEDWKTTFVLRDNFLNEQKRQVVLVIWSLPNALKTNLFEHSFGWQAFQGVNGNPTPRPSETYLPFFIQATSFTTSACPAMVMMGLPSTDQIREVWS